jgi:hypothetical protein
MPVIAVKEGVSARQPRPEQGGTAGNTRPWVERLRGVFYFLLPKEEAERR